MMETFDYKLGSCADGSLTLTVNLKTFTLCRQTLPFRKKLEVDVEFLEETGQLRRGGQIEILVRTSGN